MPKANSPRAACDATGPTSRGVTLLSRISCRSRLVLVVHSSLRSARRRSGAAVMHRHPSRQRPSRGRCRAVGRGPPSRPSSTRKISSPATAPVRSGSRTGLPAASGDRPSKKPVQTGERVDLLAYRSRCTLVTVPFLPLRCSSWLFFVRWHPPKTAGSGGRCRWPGRGLPPRQDGSGGDRESHSSCAGGPWARVVRAADPGMVVVCQRG